MNGFLRVFVVLFMALAHADEPISYPETPENRFADSYNAWIKLRQLDGPQKISIQQIRQWKQTRTLWRALDRGVRYD